MKCSDFLYRKSPNVVSVGDHGLDDAGRRFTVVAVLPLAVEVHTMHRAPQHITYTEAARLLS